MSSFSSVCVLLLCLAVAQAAKVGARGHPFDNYEAQPYWPEEHMGTGFHTDAADAPTWSYDPTDKVNYPPAKWSMIAPACGGQSQSPIDIQTASAVYKSSLTPLTLSSTALSTNMITNNGHAIQVNWNATNDKLILAGGNLPAGQSYQFLQLHFHTNSEHTINGGLGAAELHFVFQNTNPNITDARALAVVGVIFRGVDTDNTALTPITNLVDQLQFENNFTSIVGLSLAPFLKANAGYYTYPGSLTTPACSETVTWHVLADMQTASFTQIAKLHNALVSNQMPYTLTNRPVQALNTRTVLTNVMPTKMTSAAARTQSTVGVALSAVFCSVFFFVSNQWC